MSYTPGQVCENCGNESPRAKVCGGCEQAQRSFAKGAAAERARLVAVVRSHYVALFPGGDHRLDMILLAMGGGEKGSGA